MKKSIVVLIILLLIIISYFGYTKYINNDKKELQTVLKDTKNKEVNLTKYFIYGRHLHLEGTLKDDKLESDIKNVKLVLKENFKNEIEYNVEYKITNGQISFVSAKEINAGINLDNIKQGNYYLLLKITKKDDKTEYYSIYNKTKYKQAEYYTTTKNNKNSKILIEFGKTKVKKDKDTSILNYTMIKVKPVKLPENIYDIVIDPGHGGKDSGAVKDDYHEADITLKYGKDLKQSLEALGLKVKLTRDGKNEKNLGIYDIYGKGDRASIPNEVKAKYTFSLHLNSAPYKLSKGGVEIYSPANANYDLAQLLADNIVRYANTTYSPSETAKILNGVYVRTFTNDDIAVSNSEANSRGYEPYNIKPNTPYYFMIRETGGIATNAYVDGRNKDYEKNVYYDSNVGVETYLIELGFMVSDKDLNNIINNRKGYIEGITKSIKEYLKL